MRTRLIAAVLILTLLVGAPSAPAAQLVPLPIIDLHFHAEEGWDLDALVQRFDQLGVARAGNGADGSDSLALDFAEAYPGRFIPFIGERTLNRLVLNEREDAWNLISPGVMRYLDEVEAGLRSRRSRLPQRRAPAGAARRAVTSVLGTGPRSMGAHDPSPDAAGSPCSTPYPT